MNWIKNFFAAIRNFFSGIFSGKHELKTLSLRELEAELDRVNQSELEEFQKTVFSRIAEIKHLIKDIRNCLELVKNADLEARTDEENRRLIKIVETSKNTFINQMNSLLDRIFPPDSIDYFLLKKYSSESFQLFQSEINAFSKNIVYTSILAKGEVKQVGSNVGELAKVFAELNEKFDSSKKIAVVFEAKNILQQARIIAKQALEAKKKQKTIAESISTAEKEKILIENNLEEAKKSPKFQERDALLENKKRLFDKKIELKNSFLQLISIIDKPLKRAFQLGQSNDVFEKNDFQLLSNYLTNPFLAISQDKTAIGLKRILSVVLKLVEENSVELKGSEKEKKINALKELVEGNMFDSIFSEFVFLEQSIAEMEKTLREEKLPEEIALLEKKIVEANGIISREKKSTEQLQKEIDSLEQNFLSKAGKLEESCKLVFSEEILLDKQELNQLLGNSVDAD